MSCVGGLVDPAPPDVKGIQSFTGEFFHTARWNHDYDLAGRRVAVIGTGASAVQVVPSIAREVSQLHVFQRTPAWVVPKRDKRYSQRAKQRFARFPLALHLSRLSKYWLSEFFGPVVFLDSKRLSKVGEKLSLAHLRQQVEDPELRAKLMPGFQFGCKRILISDDYWSSFERENVEQRSVTPADASASIIALITVGVAPTVPPSPAPLTPSGFVVEGTGCIPTTKDGRSSARGMQ